MTRSAFWFSVLVCCNISLVLPFQIDAKIGNQFSSFSLILYQWFQTFVKYTPKEPPLAGTSLIWGMSNETWRTSGPVSGWGSGRFRTSSGITRWQPFKSVFNAEITDIITQKGNKQSVNFICVVKNSTTTYCGNFHTEVISSCPFAHTRHIVNSWVDLND